MHRRLPEAIQLPIDVPATIAFLREQRRLERMVLPRDYPHPAPMEG